MNRVMTATTMLEEIYLDEFKSACLDKEGRAELLLDLHKYFKFQNKVYTFTATAHINRIFNELLIGRISDNVTSDTLDVGYPLTVLTEISQMLIMRLSQVEITEDAVPTRTVVGELAQELAELMTMHGHKQEWITNDNYQSTIKSDEWKNILISNPWLMVGVLLRYTTFALTENIYNHWSENSDLLKRLAKQ